MCMRFHIPVTLHFNFSKDYVLTITYQKAYIFQTQVPTRVFSNSIRLMPGFMPLIEVLLGSNLGHLFEVCTQAEKTLANLCKCAGSPEPQLLYNAVSNKILCIGPRYCIQLAFHKVGPDKHIFSIKL